MHFDKRSELLFGLNSIADTFKNVKNVSAQFQIKMLTKLFQKWGSSLALIRTNKFDVNK